MSSQLPPSSARRDAASRRLWKFICAPLFAVACIATTPRLQAASAGDAYEFSVYAGADGVAGSQDGSRTDARFSSPNGVAVDAEGIVYVGDSGNYTIRRIATDGQVTTVAGDAGVRGNDDLIGTAATFGTIMGLAADDLENIFVTDYTAVRRINPGLTVTTIAGSPTGTGTADGTGGAARFGLLAGIAVDAAGDLYIADSHSHTIRKHSGFRNPTTPTGTVTTVAGSAGNSGTADGNGTAARFNQPWGIGTDNEGNVYVADNGNHVIRKITPQGVVSTLAGSPGASGSADGMGSAARFDSPLGLAVDAEGNVFVSDFSNGIRRITPDGRVTTLSRPSVDFGLPMGLAVASDGTLYVADSVRNVIYKGTPARVPQITLHPNNQAAASGATVTLLAGADSGTGEWLRNGAAITPAPSGSSLVLGAFAPEHAGLYQRIFTATGGSTATTPAIVGIQTSEKLIGPGDEVLQDVLHPNGNVYDQILLQGTATSVTADAQQVLRMSYVDLSDDIVQVEFSGAGTLTLTLDSVSGPATPVNYVQPGVSYMKGHGSIVIVGANETTNISVFSVGRATAVNTSLFIDSVDYDGVADLGYLAILSSNGKFGGIRTGNTRFWHTRGYTGLYAPDVEFTGPVYVGDINAADAAVPVLLVGSVSDARLTGGSLKQDNAEPVQVAGIAKLAFTGGSSSHGDLLPAQTNQARLEQDGVDVTDQVAVNP